MKEMNYQGQYQEVFQRNNRLYVIKKTNDESRELYLNRVNYIINKLETNGSKNYDEIVKLSYIWRNYTYKGMIYPSSIIKSL